MGFYYVGFLYLALFLSVFVILSLLLPFLPPSVYSSISPHLWYIWREYTMYIISHAHIHNFINTNHTQPKLFVKWASLSVILTIFCRAMTLPGDKILFPASKWWSLHPFWDSGERLFLQQANKTQRWKSRFTNAKIGFTCNLSVPSLLCMVSSYLSLSFFKNKQDIWNLESLFLWATGGSKIFSWRQLDIVEKSTDFSSLLLNPLNLGRFSLSLYLLIWKAETIKWPGRSVVRNKGVYVNWWCW